MERRRAGWGAAGTEGRLLFQRSEPDTSLPATPTPLPPPVVQVLVAHGIVKCLSRRDTAQEYVKGAFPKPEG